MNKTPVGIPLSRESVIIADTELLRYLRREFPSAGNSLVTYFAKGTRRWCLAVWKDKMKGYVQEITSWGSPAELTRPKMFFIRWWLSDARRKGNKEFMSYRKSKARQEGNALTDAARERAERMEFLKKHMPGTMKDDPRVGLSRRSH